MVNQGITVFGNNGSTFQHYYIQSLKYGLNDFYAIFIEVLKDEQVESMIVEPVITAGDFLNGFYLGTRQALTENYRNYRESISITIKEISSKMIGTLIVLFERAVGFYASLVNINAYDQPDVEAGNKAASKVIEIQKLILCFLKENSKQSFSFTEIANAIKHGQEFEWEFIICNHLSENSDHEIRKLFYDSPLESKYSSF